MTQIDTDLTISKSVQSEKSSTKCDVFKQHFANSVVEKSLFCLQSAPSVVEKVLLSLFILFFLINFAASNYETLFFLF